jgi:hypothetical protein
MLKQNKKYKPVFLLLGTLFFAIYSGLNFYGFAIKNEGMKLTGGILFGVMAIIYAVDFYEVIKNNKSINSGA